MKSASVIAAVAIVSTTLLSEPAHAAGCLKGAVIGGLAGHYAGNHGLLGAGAGCWIGRHHANKHAPSANEQQQSHRPVPLTH